MKRTTIEPRVWASDLHPPRPRLTVDGYTVRAGSPSTYRVWWEGKWRRVYVWCFSNGATAFVRIKGTPHIVPDFCFPGGS